ncbi:MAG: hypothetical protein A4E40_00592 [Methanoregulaceae archaeon PtaU1.Bin059]|nr:MAG: hypothetical protein A4E39_00396 [Methanoregulaceae archaeon PtaB.Bin152]OPY41534.1 MAG: hypothetical protein A4E40_00592 [Methanoregulaceae archaeon PtaU1.Bin059]
MASGLKSVALPVLATGFGSTIGAALISKEKNRVISICQRTRLLEAMVLHPRVFYLSGICIDPEKRHPFPQVLPQIIPGRA